MQRSRLRSCAGIAAAWGCAALIAVGVPASAVSRQQPPRTSPSDRKPEPIWADEFEQPGLPDPSRWDYEVGGHGWGNNELQFYTARRAENARVENGRLVIEARREAWSGREYTSARLVSKAQWTYGRFEIRARLPCGRGTWPAIWMLPARANFQTPGWPETGEIDIMEHVGHDPGVIHASIHTGAYNWPARTQKTATVRIAGACDAFHAYALEWTQAGLRAFVDDREYFTFANERLTNRSAGRREWPFDAPFAFRLNVAVGGNWGGERGVDPSVWPQRMEIDYVRVFRRAQDQSPQRANALQRPAVLLRLSSGSGFGG